MAMISYPSANRYRRYNDMRKAMSSQMYEVALNKADHQSDFIIISDDSFHEGIVGLVAGKLCDELQRPCMVLASKGDMLRGSIRSCNGVDLTDFFDGLKCLERIWRACAGSRHLFCTQ
ncbi:MAG: hypothetical protein V8S30_02465 [Merdibacter sp.]